MILLFLRFMVLQRMKGICRKGFMAQNTTGLGVCRGLLKSLNLIGCFPPKPPTRSVMHSDHRRAAGKQQEYRGNQREVLFKAELFVVQQPPEMRRSENTRQE